MTVNHHVRVYRSKDNLACKDQLAYKIAEVAADAVPVDADVTEMIANRVIDNTGVAVASLTRRPVAAARQQAQAHPRIGGATVIGLPRAQRFSCEWAAWANATAVRELDFHDTFLAADMNHPGDVIAPVVAAAQQCGRNGADVIRGIAAAYEIAVNLARGMCLHEHRIDHIMHIGAGAVAGIGSALQLPVEVIYQALNHIVHVTVASRQSRKGEISSWKANAPAHVGKLAVEAIDRAMRGETSPAPIYEGEDSIIAWMLDGPEADYVIPLPDLGEAKRAILDTYTKEHSAEYQSQALIDLAFRMRRRIADLSTISEVVIYTSHHTHHVIGTGSGDPQKFNPAASRETLDHSAMYIFAVALEDGVWHHVESYRPERAARPSTVTLWKHIRTVEDPEWTRRYHSLNVKEKAFGGRVEIRLNNGTKIEEEITVADAHPLGARPFTREHYIKKFRGLADDLVDFSEIERFLDTVKRLPELAVGELDGLNIMAKSSVIASTPATKGLF